MSNDLDVPTGDLFRIMDKKIISDINFLRIVKKLGLNLEDYIYSKELKTELHAKLVLEHTLTKSEEAINIPLHMNSLYLLNLISEDKKRSEINSVNNIQLNLNNAVVEIMDNLCGKTTLTRGDIVTLAVTKFIKELPFK